VPVLLEGESGTGKELFAKAIHKASPRGQQKLVPVNCGAIPSELIESELFGHVKGSFTGAIRGHQGFFEQAHGGTLFLDEIGELSLPAQVKLLRVLQEKEIRPIGAAHTKKIDVRIITATNRNLKEEVRAGRFRLDLFFRLAVATIYLPPLRERGGDLGLLIDKSIEKVNKELEQSEPAYEHKIISPGARNLLLNHYWPGNVRELEHTILRTAIWTSGPMIDEVAMKDAIIMDLLSSEETIMGRPLGNGFDLKGLLADVARDYINRAMAETCNRKIKAADLLGFRNYQTLSNWVKKLLKDS
jgi:transcriptional regulator with PAS, ATPase and Fis domain